MKGVYPDMSAKEYHQAEGVSSSALRAMRGRHPYDSLYYRQHPKKPTAMMQLGTQVHLALFEPNAFERCYVDYPQKSDGKKVPKAGKENERIWEEWTLQLGEDQEGIDAEDREQVYDIVKDLREHELVAALLQKALSFECSMFWEDQKTGTLCKARPDIVIPEIKGLFDLKVTTKADSHSFSHAIEEYGYHVQLHHYAEGARALDLEIERLGLIVVERDEPRAIETYLIPTDEKKAAATEWRELLDQYAECQESGQWPRHTIGFKDIYRPIWAQKK